jgi:hypothetical protein
MIGGVAGRIDNEYAVPWKAFVALAERLGDDHQTLEIDGRRTFGYTATYFDTPLRCLSIT